MLEEERVGRALLAEGRDKSGAMVEERKWCGTDKGGEGVSTKGERRGRQIGGVGRIDFRIERR